MNWSARGLAGLSSSDRKPSSEAPIVDLSIDACYDEMNDHHDNINEDGPKAFYYPQARRLAVRQTTFEWCRTLDLAQAKWGARGVAALMGLWMRSSPHPAGTPCSLRRGPSHWWAWVTRILVKHTTDDDDGDLNLTFAVADRASADTKT